MASSHNHTSSDYGQAFAIGVTLNLAFVIVEFIYGNLSNSLALVADAGHNLSDVLGLSLAWWAAALSRRHPTPSRTYGMRRSSILAALINAITFFRVSEKNENNEPNESSAHYVAMPHFRSGRNYAAICRHDSAQQR